MDVMYLISNMTILCIFEIEKVVAWNAYSTQGPMTMLSILIYFEVSLGKHFASQVGLGDFFMNFLI